MSEQQLREQLDRVYSSTSWRITAPLRALGNFFQVKRSLIGILASFVASLIRFCARFKMLRRIANGIFSYFPSLRLRVRRVLFIHPVLIVSPPVPHVVEDLRKSKLSSDAFMILQQLAALRKNR